MEARDVWINLNVNVLNWMCPSDFQVESPVGDYKSLETWQETNGLENGFLSPHVMVAVIQPLLRNKVCYFSCTTLQS